MENEEIKDVILITGAASGIGLCFVKHYLNQPNTLVIAGDINKIETKELPPGTVGRLKTYEVDFASDASIQDCTKSIAGILRPLDPSVQCRRIDLVIHSAGVRGLVPDVVDAEPNNVAAAETLQVMNSQVMERTYKINTVGTFVLLQSLATLCLFHEKDQDIRKFSKVMIMTSRMGSISYNTIGAGYAYRASKAALNAIVRSLSIDIPHVMFALVHPGRVETGLTRCREEGAIEVEESVEDMLKLLGTLELKDSGRFCDRFGKVIGW